MDVQVKRGDILFNADRLVKNADGKWFMTLYTMWGEGDEDLLCPLEELSPILDRLIRDEETDPECVLAGYTKAKKEAQAKGEYDEAWTANWFMDRIEETADDDPWDNREIGNVLCVLWNTFKSRSQGIPEDVVGKKVDNTFRIDSETADIHVEMDLDEFARRAAKVLDDGQLTKIANDFRNERKRKENDHEE